MADLATMVFRSSGRGRAGFGAAARHASRVIGLDRSAWSINEIPTLDQSARLPSCCLTQSEHPRKFLLANWPVHGMQVRLRNEWGISMQLHEARLLTGS